MFYYYDKKCVFLINNSKLIFGITTKNKEMSNLKINIEKKGIVILNLFGMLINSLNRQIFITDKQLRIASNNFWFCKI